MGKATARDVAALASAMDNTAAAIRVAFEPISTLTTPHPRATPAGTDSADDAESER